MASNQVASPPAPVFPPTARGGRPRPRPTSQFRPAPAHQQPAGRARLELGAGFGWASDESDESDESGDDGDEERQEEGHEEKEEEEEGDLGGPQLGASHATPSPPRTSHPQHAAAQRAQTPQTPPRHHAVVADTLRHTRGAAAQQVVLEADDEPLRASPSSSNEWQSSTHLAFRQRAERLGEQLRACALQRDDNMQALNNDVGEYTRAHVERVLREEADRRRQEEARRKRKEAEARQAEEERQRKEQAAAEQAKKAKESAKRAEQEKAKQQQQQQQQQQQPQPQPRERPQQQARAGLQWRQTSCAFARCWELGDRLRAERQRLLQSREQVKAAPQLKRFVKEQRKMINTIANQVPNDNPQALFALIGKLTQVLQQAKAQGEPVYHEALLVCGEKLVDQGESGQLLTVTEAAFPYATLLCAVAKSFPELCGVLLAELHERCVFSLPRFVETSGPNGAKISLDECRKLRRLERQDDGSWEQPEKFYERMAGMLRLLAACACVPNPHPFHQAACGSSAAGVPTAWQWVACVLGMPPRASTAPVLVEFIRTAGPSLLYHYRSQFVKLLKHIRDDFLPAIRAHTKNVGVSASFCTRLQILVEEALVDGTFKGSSLMQPV